MSKVSSPTGWKRALLLAVPLVAAAIATTALLGRSAPSSAVAAVNFSEEITRTPTAQPTVHHRNTPTTTATPTKMPVPPTATFAPIVVIAATATPSGGVGPQVVAPLTGTGSSGGGSFPLAPIALAAALGATALAGATYVRRTSSRRG